MKIEASHIDQSHYGQHVKVKHVDGILRVANKSGLVMEIVAQNADGSIQGVRVAGNEEVEIEKTLENQIRDDFKNIADNMKSTGIKFLRKRLK